MSFPDRETGHTDELPADDRERPRAVSGLPSTAYEVVIKPLRYRTDPHLAALCDFDGRRITLQVPTPFRPFKEIVYHGARRKRGSGMHFTWLSENVIFRSRRDVLRFLYCHEWLHWYLHEQLKKKIGGGDRV